MVAVQARAEGGAALMCQSASDLLLPGCVCVQSLNCPASTCSAGLWNGCHQRPNYQ